MDGCRTPGIGRGSDKRRRRYTKTNTETSIDSDKESLLLSRRHKVKRSHSVPLILKYSLLIKHPTGFSSWTESAGTAQLFHSADSGDLSYMQVP